MILNTQLSLKERKSNFSDARTEGRTIDQVVSKRDGTELPRKGQGQWRGYSTGPKLWGLGLNAYAGNGPLKELPKKKKCYQEKNHKRIKEMQDTRVRKEPAKNTSVKEKKQQMYKIIIVMMMMVVMKFEGMKK